MDPSMDANFMALRHHPALLVGMQEGGDRRHVKRALDPMLFQHVQDPRHAYPIAVLTPRQAADRLTAVAQIACLVIAVERHSDRATGAARPFGRPQPQSCGGAVDQLAPMLLGPLPGL